MKKEALLKLLSEKFRNIKEYFWEREKCFIDILILSLRFDVFSILFLNFFRLYEHFPCKYF